MGKKILTFGNIEIEKNNFTVTRLQILLGDIAIAKVLVFKKISFGEKNKFFTGYLYNNHKVKPLHIMLPKTRTYVKRYDY